LPAVVGDGEDGVRRQRGFPAPLSSRGGRGGGWRTSRTRRRGEREPACVRLTAASGGSHGQRWGAARASERRGKNERGNQGGVARDSALSGPTAPGAVARRGRRRGRRLRGRRHRAREQVGWAGPRGPVPGRPPSHFFFFYFSVSVFTTVLQMLGLKCTFIK
jgi:hypothetical protein